VEQTLQKKSTFNPIKIPKLRTINKKGGDLVPVLDGIEHEGFEFVDSDVTKAGNILALHVVAVKIITDIVNCPNQ
jgi:hypothetical protein